MSSEIWNQLLLLKGITKSTGVIHEAQVLQLKMWGRLAFEKAKEVDIAVGIDDSTHLVEYRVKAGSKTPTKKTLKVIKVLDRLVKCLLGDNFETRVKYNDRAIFRSKGLAYGIGTGTHKRGKNSESS